MGKIKGWKKVMDGDEYGEGTWRNITSKHKIAVVHSAPLIDGWKILINYGAGEGWETIVRHDGSHFPKYMRREEAKGIALRYMRSHPNG